MTKNKLGLGIIAFEGTELIAQTVMEIKDLVDYVVVGFQKKSYTGDDCDPNDEYELVRLKEEGIIDQILYIETNHFDFPRVQETEKRNKIVDNLIEQNCTHQLIIDSDEFYTHDSFARAKDFIYKNDIEMSYCRYVNYFHDYRHYLVYPFKDGTYVPFIAKTKYRFAWQCEDFPFPSDPTRRYVRPKQFLFDSKTHQPIIKIVKDMMGNEHKVHDFKYTVDFHIFDWKELKMHHFSWLRNNIRKKMNAWSSKSYFDNYLEIIDKSAEKFNRFEFNPEDKETYLLFNTPGNKLEIAEFNKQYVFPKPEYDYKKRFNNQSQNRIILSFEEKFDLDSFINKLDAISKTEKFKDHFDKIQSRPLKNFDYLVFYLDKTILNKEKIIDFTDRLVDDSVIYFSEDENVLILSFETVQKLRKYYKQEWCINHDLISGIKLIMKEYCRINDLTYDLYFDTYTEKGNE